MVEARADRNADLRAAIDAFGADLTRWDDRELADKLREAALADRGLRAWLDGAAALEHQLAGAREAADVEIRASGALDRVRAAVALRRRPGPRRLRWIAAAAAILLAAGLGGVVDAEIANLSASQSVDVVVLDPLVFGPLGTDVE